MKRILLSAALLAAFATTTEAQNTIPNGNFETWTSQTIDLPNGWNTSMQENNGVVTSSKATDGRSGSAIKLESKTDENNEVQFGFFANTPGDPTNAEGGSPYTQQPTSINGYYKANIVAGDSVILLVIFKKNGAPISQSFFKIGVSATSYTQFTFPLSVPVAPDSVIFAMASSDVIDNPNAPAGTWVIVDDISFGGTGITQQLVNSNFDSWTTETKYNIVNWSSFGEVTRTTEHYKGETAAKLLVTDGGGSTWGAMMQLGTNGVPCTKTNDTLVFYYKFNSVNNDSAQIWVGLMLNGNGVGGNFAQLAPASTFTRMEIPIGAGVTPDTLTIGVSIAGGQEHSPNLNSYLIIDEMTFASEPLNTGLFNWTKTANQANVYPNPFATSLQVWSGAFKNINYNITDLSGKSILTGAVENNNINTETLNKGIYFVTLTSNGQTIAVKKITKE